MSFWWRICDAIEFLGKLSGSCLDFCLLLLGAIGRGGKEDPSSCVFLDFRDKACEGSCLDFCWLLLLGATGRGGKEDSSSGALLDFCDKA